MVAFHKKILLFNFQLKPRFDKPKNKRMKKVYEMKKKSLNSTMKMKLLLWTIQKAAVKHVEMNFQKSVPKLLLHVSTNLLYVVNVLVSTTIIQCFASVVKMKFKLLLLTHHHHHQHLHKKKKNLNLHLKSLKKRKFFVVSQRFGPKILFNHWRRSTPE
eukprot:CAMPEP_0197347890 /NCGR_PEP_ID=MMETSP0893-20130614/7840_1 /TAXON_ID=44058 ORGANISM="Aureoumbra lagunensis, Strain CCMP1510" /NCGR_SAMPLE_ID=MMETSP0893 /ASSEMBLY_ACC=CAM_ASM_000539 /LENGTH=157 /DNA_ID=CAMNT_0042858053 /DNA_START=171 /DNA_END=644 /DNA_ORIENTATION=-